MLATKFLLLIVPLLHNADAQMGKFSGEAATITAPPELSTPHMANSLDIARNVSAEFPLGVTISPPITKYVPPNQSNVIEVDPSKTGQLENSKPYQPSYWTQPASQAIAHPITSYIPPCWTSPTTHRPKTPSTPPCWKPPTTHRPKTPSTPPCWSPPTTHRPTTPYIPPCWIHQTPRTTSRPFNTTPRPITPPPTTPYIPPCWTPPITTTTSKPISTTQRHRTLPPTTPYIPPCWTPPITTTTSKPISTTQRHRTLPPTTPYIPPCWTHPTTQPPTVAPITSAPHNYYVCQERNHYYEIPTECNTYIECKDNAASKKICPWGMIFKPDTVWPANPCVSSSEYKCTHGYILDKIPQNICPES